MGGCSKNVIILSGVMEMDGIKYFVSQVVKDLGPEFARGDKVDRMLMKGRMGALLYKVRSKKSEEDALDKAILFSNKNRFCIISKRFSYKFSK